MGATELISGSGIRGSCLAVEGLGLISTSGTRLRELGFQVRFAVSVGRRIDIGKLSAPQAPRV